MHENPTPGDGEWRKVRLLVPWSGEGFTYERDAILDVHEQLAIALCSEPADSPRAVPIGWNLPDELRHAEEERNPPGVRRAT